MLFEADEVFLAVEAIVIGAESRSDKPPFDMEEVEIKVTWSMRIVRKRAKLRTCRIFSCYSNIPFGSAPADRLCVNYAAASASPGIMSAKH